MAFAFLQDVPIRWELYREIRAELGEKPPPGFVLHVVIETAQGLRYLDVWESREAHRAFAEGTLHQVVPRVLARGGITRPPTEPRMDAITVREVWFGAPDRLYDPERSASGAPASAAS
jgi:hypothetical protein